MRSRPRWVAVFLLFAAANVPAAQYKLALPGYRYNFPRDHFNHPEFQTEWWYYTGNVQSSGGRRFGFELTFFRQGVDRNANPNGAWDVHDLYVAHLALSDLDGTRFFHAERTNRGGPGIAGISEAERRIWNGNWQVIWRGNNQELQALDECFALRVTLQSAKTPVIQGENGVSQKAEGPGRASHYISLTRLNTTGEVQLSAKTFQVTGTAWMDHEFFTQQLTADQVGWDWMSIQFRDNSELMLFQIRRRNGSIDPHSAGTFVDSRGRSTHLDRDDFTLEPTGTTWTSPVTRAVYPVRWQISIRKLNITLDCATSLPSQELASSTEMIPAYWEGSVMFAGNKNGFPLDGVGYLEMTGYDRPIAAFH